MNANRFLKILRLTGLALSLLPAVAGATAIDRGAASLQSSQDADGSWISPRVRTAHATAEALRALHTLNTGAAARVAAADFLLATPAEDTDDLGRRIDALGAEGRNVAPLVTELAAAADPFGGWGLFPGLVADPLDSAIALTALAPRAGVDNALLNQGLGALLAAQRADGGWACVDGADSELYCTAQGLLALAPYQTRFFLGDAPARARAFIAARRNADGSYGPVGLAGEDTVFNTALSALALAASATPGPERLGTIAFLEGRQAADGSWGGDPYQTALALRALKALASGATCGDGVVNQASETCDGADLRGATCGSFGLGSGTVSCTPSCTIDTSACSAPATCGDGIVNQASEICDGLDLRGATCESVGLGAGLLSCSSSCTLNTTSCSAPPACGDGIRNQSSESCDGLDLGGATCSSLGFPGGGSLSCASDCTFEAAACESAPICGDGVINRSAEECDVLDFGGATCSSLGFVAGELRCGGSCRIDTSACTEPGESDPLKLVIEPSSPVCAGGTATVPVTLTFPPSAVVNQVDVFLLFDDTGSFAGNVPNVRTIFSQLVTELQTALPDVSLAFGVGRFEDNGGPSTSFSGDSNQARPFILSQPLITTDTPDFLTRINTALQRTTPGGGGDGPETNIEALWQVATGEGFDGNGNGSALDSGAAGAANTQTAPGTSGDIPPFSSNVAAASGTLGGAGFRLRSLHLVIQAGDICPVAPFAAGQPVPNTLTALNGATVPTSALRCSNTLGSQRYGFVGTTLARNTSPANSVVPVGSATVPELITALNQLGISVIGIGNGVTAVRNPVTAGNLSHYFSAMALLTGAVDSTGNPLVFSMSGGTTPLKNAIVQAVRTAATRPVDVALRPRDLPAGLELTFAPFVVENVGPGGAATFQVTLTGDGSALTGGFALDFVDLGTNSVLGTVPGELRCLAPVAGPEDEDGDGFPAGPDCDDTNPGVNPGAEEIPGNGIDDDCNPATPDEVPAAALVCNLTTDRLNYSPGDVVTLNAALHNLEESLTLSGLEAELTVNAPGGGPVLLEQSRSLAPLHAGVRDDQTFGFATAGQAAGEYEALVEILSGGEPYAACSAGFRVESTDATGAGLSGILAVDPTVVNAGSPAAATFTVLNQGSSDVANLPIRVVLVDPDTEQVVGEIRDTAPLLAVGGSHDGTGTFATAGLAQKTYLAILLVTVQSGEQALATAELTVVNEAPDCTGAVASVSEIWPPNHKMKTVTINGVTDPDGDPLAVIITGIFQDERTNAAGDGNTCPDATGTGTSTASLRAERSGTGDGRVYHVRFAGDDGRGGQCTGTVTVCVPHDQGHGTCVDQGALFDSTVCN